MNALGIIPARYGSTRLEGKPLVDIVGKTMIERVYEKAKVALEYIVVATDDQRIFDTVKGFGGQVVMTSSDHTTGTNRCLEAYEIYSKEMNQEFDVIVNIQGDEPLLISSQIESLLSCFAKPDTRLATLIIPVSSAEDLFNESECFVTFDKNDNAMYFSRSVIPHIRDVHKTKWLQHHTYYKHLGLYAYTPSALAEFAGLEQTDLEKAESLEQNRWLENGNPIRVAITNHDSIPVDTVDDLEKVRKIVKEQEGT